MDIMEYKGFEAKIKYDNEDNIFFGIITNISDCLSFDGTNVEDLRKAFEETVEDYENLCKSLKKDIVFIQSIEKHNIKIYRKLYDKLRKLSKNKQKTINSLVNNMILDYFNNENI